MVQGVQFNLLVKDLGSSPLAKFAKNAEKSVNRVKRITKGLEGVLVNTNRKTNTLDRTIRNLGGKGQLGINKQLQTANGHVDRLINKMNRIRTLGSMAGRGASTRKTYSRLPIGGLGSLMTNYIAPVAVIAGFANMIKAGAQFESKLVDIRGILGTSNGFSDQAFGGLIEKIQGIGKKTIFTMRQVADATKFMAMAGLNIQQIEDSLKAVTNIAAVGNLGVERAADIVTNISTSMGISAKRMVDVSDLLTGVFTKTNVSLEEQGEAFAYAGNVAAQNGVKIEELATSIGILGNAGIKGSRAGTNLRQLMLRLVAPTEAARGVMEKYGISFTQTAEDGRVLQKSFKDIIKMMNAAEVSAADKKTLFGIFGGQAFSAMSTQFTDDGQLLLEVREKQVKQMSGIADTLSAAKMRTLSGRVAILKANFEVLSIALTKKVQPGLAMVVSTLNKFVKWLTTDGSFVIKGLGKAFVVLGNVVRYAFEGIKTILLFAKNNWRWLKMVAAGILAVNAAVKLWNGTMIVSSAITAIYSGALILFKNGLFAVKNILFTVRYAMLAFNGAIAANPIGAIVVGIVALSAAIIYAWNNFEGFRATVLSSFNILKLVVAGIWNWLKNIGTLFLKVSNDILVPIAEWMHNKFGAAIEWVGQKAHWLGQAFNSAKDYIETFIDAISNKIAPLKELFKSVFSILRPIIDGFIAPFQKVIDFFDGVLDSIVQIFDKIKDNEWAKAVFGVTNLGLVKEISTSLSNNNVNDAVSKGKASATTAPKFDFGFSKKLNLPDPTKIKKNFGNIQAIDSKIKGDVGTSGITTSVDKFSGDDYDFSMPSPKTDFSSTNQSFAPGRNIIVEIKGPMLQVQEVNQYGETPEGRDILDELSEQMMGVVRDVELGLSN